MYRNLSETKKSADWIVIILYVLLVLMGEVSIIGACGNVTSFADIFSFSEFYGKQLVWILCAFAIAFSILKIEAKTYLVFSYVFYVCAILLLIVTIGVAPEIKGSRSWLVLGPVSIQPAEFAKFATALALARYMSRYDFDILKTRHFLISCAILFLPIVCILLQQETGSALVYSVLILVFYREGLPDFFLFLFIWVIFLFILILRNSSVIFDSGEQLGNLLAYGFILLAQIVITLLKEPNKKIWRVLALVNLGVMLAVWLFNLFGWAHIDYEYVLMGLIGAGALFHLGYFLSFIMKRKLHLLIAAVMIGSLGYSFSVNYIFTEILQPHQQMRIKVTLGIEEDPYGAGYNVNQSKIAIGSGGFSGKGFLNGTQTKLKYVPEQHTDFIFCTVCEEFGFLGALAVILTYLALIYRLLYLAEHQSSRFSRIYGYCVACIFFFHLLINIGMVIGLMPVIGIPLPFFSYGGSSLWSFTILLFIFLCLDKAEK